MSLRDLASAPGLKFPSTGPIMMRVIDDWAIINSMRQALPPHTPFTQYRAKPMITELLDACHKHRELMAGRGRTSDRFWLAVMRDVAWTRLPNLHMVEEFALEMVKAARLALSPEHYALLATSGAAIVALDLPGYKPVSWAALRFLRDIKMFEKPYAVPARDGEDVKAYRGIEITEAGIRSEPIRCKPGWGLVWLELGTGGKAMKGGISLVSEHNQ